MKTLKISIAALSVLVLVEAAHSQTVGIGTTKGGATAQVTAAISKVVTIKGQLKMRPQPMGGTQQYIPMSMSGNSILVFRTFPSTGWRRPAPAYRNASTTTWSWLLK